MRRRTPRCCERAGGDVPGYPEGDGLFKVPAAWLIARAGFPKGYGSGRARLSTKHVLAITNRGGATAADVLALAREVRDGVRDQLGVLPGERDRSGRPRTLTRVS